MNSENIVFIREVHPADIDYLGEHLREIDKEEIRLMHGEAFDDDFTGVIEEGYSMSKAAYTALRFDGTPILMFGITEKPLCFVKPDGDASPAFMLPVWLLSTNDVYTRRVKFLRLSRHFLREFADMSEYPIGNFIYDGNILHNRWALWCGFNKAWSVIHNGAQFNLYLYYEKR